VAIQRALLQHLIATLEPDVQRAFYESINGLRGGVDLARVIDALSRGDINQALNSLRIEVAAFGPLDAALAEAYRQSGLQTAASFPTVRAPDGGSVFIRFDGRSPQAEQWIANLSSTRIVQVVEDQRVAARNALAAGLEAGKGPRTVALDVAGRYNRQTGQREGGILGLTSTQEAYARAYEAELRSGDPARLRRALERGRRDVRFDRSVIKAIDGKEPLEPSQINRMVARYKDKLLDLRATTVSRTETMNAIFASRHETFRQAVASGQIREDQITRTWMSAGDTRVRDTHNHLHGKKVKGLSTPFITARGNRLLYPHQEGAAAEEVINCRCDVTYRVSPI
jgi:hypothetical protein